MGIGPLALGLVVLLTQGDTTMRQSVRNNFFDFTAAREGYVLFMSVDILNLVTTGVGNLIDNGPRNGYDISDAAMAPVFNLTWYHKGPGWGIRNASIGAQATPEEVKAEWIKVKLVDQEQPGFKLKGGFAYAGLTTLTLSADGLMALFNRTLDSFEKTLKTYLPNWEQWPADAQLATLSMAWAMGPAFPHTFVKWTQEVNTGDFAAAAEDSYFIGGGGTQSARTGRNGENQKLFLAAANTIATGGDLEAIHLCIKPSGIPGTGGGNKPPPATPAAGSGGGSSVARVMTGLGLGAALGWAVNRWWL